MLKKLDVVTWVALFGAAVPTTVAHAQLIKKNDTISIRNMPSQYRGVRMTLGDIIVVQAHSERSTMSSIADTVCRDVLGMRYATRHQFTNLLREEFTARYIDPKDHKPVQKYVVRQGKRLTHGLAFVGPRFKRTMYKQGKQIPLESQMEARFIRSGTGEDLSKHIRQGTAFQFLSLDCAPRTELQKSETKSNKQNLAVRLFPASPGISDVDTTTAENEAPLSPISHAGSPDVSQSVSSSGLSLSGTLSLTRSSTAGSNPSGSDSSAGSPTSLSGTSFDASLGSTVSTNSTGYSINSAQSTTSVYPVQITEDIQEEITRDVAPNTLVGSQDVSKVVVMGDFETEQEMHLFARNVAAGLCHGVGEGKGSPKFKLKTIESVDDLRSSDPSTMTFFKLYSNLTSSDGDARVLGYEHMQLTFSGPHQEPGSAVDSRTAESLQCGPLWQGWIESQLEVFGKRV